MENRTLPLNIQFFAEPGAQDPPAGNQGVQTPPAGANPPASQTPQIDYDKIAQLIQGKQAATEDSVIKGYLKQQGLTKEQMEQAIATFKQQQAANTPDIGAIQTQLTQAQEAAQKAMVDSAATMAAVGLWIDVKTIPYVLKMADLSQVMGQDGKVNEETLKTALNKVLEDVPALKPQAQQASGFQIGASGGSQTTTNEDALKKAFGL